MLLSQKLLAAIRNVPDYPTPGIVFKDITPVLADPALVTEIITELVTFYKPLQIDAVAGVEARGFILGSVLAHELQKPFIPIRKAGKLPFETIKQEYDLEYGTAAIEMHIDAIKPQWKVLIHDDLLATGGTAGAAAGRAHPGPRPSWPGRDPGPAGARRGRRRRRCQYVRPVQRGGRGIPA